MGESEGGGGGHGATYAGISLVSSLGNKETEVVREKASGGRWQAAEPVAAGPSPLGHKSDGWVWWVRASYPARHAQIGPDIQQSAEGAPRSQAACYLSVTALRYST